MKINLKSWQIFRNAFEQPVFIRQAYFDDMDYISEGNIEISEAFGTWYVDRPFSEKFITLETKTAEALMFKIDLYLLENDKYRIIENPFIFPDNDL